MEIELVFFPLPEIGHLVSAVELAKRLITLDDRFSVTILNVVAPFTTTSHAYTKSVASSFPRIRSIDLPPVDLTAQQHNLSGEAFYSVFIDSHKPHVLHTLTEQVRSRSTSGRVGALIVDLFAVSMIDVASELGIPTYVYYPAGGSSLGLMFHFPFVHTQIPTDSFKDYADELLIPSFINPVPTRVLPLTLQDKRADGYTWFLNYARRIKEAKGVIVNTFSELEPQAVNSFADDQTPPVYPVGPLLDPKSPASENNSGDKIMEWLDKQPTSSVIFVCFGSRGAFGEPQVKEIALGLERSGHRFVWSLRRPSINKHTPPCDCTSPEEILPEGFLDRTDGRGLIVGWVPQVEVLAHRAIGGFLSHCGWNSILESLWCGVPILVWPLYGEQKLNAFQLVKELGMAVELMNDDKSYGVDLVRADELETGVRCVMDGDSEVRKKVKEMKKKCRKAVVEGGSSFASMDRLIDDLKGGNKI